MKALVIYHGSCIDGFTAAWVVRRTLMALGQEEPEMFAAYYPPNSNEDDTFLPNVVGRNVYMVDFCVHRGQLLRLKEQAESLLVLDHHETHREACADLNSFAQFDMSRSGAALAWDYFHSGRSMSEAERAPGRPWLVNYAQDRDLWRFELESSRAVTAYLMCQEMSWDNWERISEMPLSQIVPLGFGAEQAINAIVREAFRAVRRIRFPKHGGIYLKEGLARGEAGDYYDDIPVVNMSYFGTSEAVGALAKTGLFAVGWYQQADGFFRYNLRSRNDFDVSAVAKAHGGGGHKQSAGFTVKQRIHD